MIKENRNHITIVSRETMANMLYGPKAKYDPVAAKKRQNIIFASRDFGYRRSLIK